MSIVQYKYREHFALDLDGGTSGLGRYVLAAKTEKYDCCDIVLVLVYVVVAGISSEDKFLDFSDFRNVEFG